MQENTNTLSFSPRNSITHPLIHESVYDTPKKGNEEKPCETGPIF